MSIPILCFVGRSNSGKTTLIERLIPVLVREGYRIATAAATTPRTATTTTIRTVLGILHSIRHAAHASGDSACR